MPEGLQSQFRFYMLIPIITTTNDLLVWLSMSSPQSRSRAHRQQPPQPYSHSSWTFLTLPALLWLFSRCSDGIWKDLSLCSSYSLGVGKTQRHFRFTPVAAVPDGLSTYSDPGVGSANLEKHRISARTSKFLEKANRSTQGSLHHRRNV